MYEDFAPKLAKVLTEYCVPIEAGQLVIINASTVAEPLVEALYAAILKRGAYPRTEIGLPNLGEIYTRYANEDQWKYVSPIEMATVNECDVFLSIRASTNTKQFTNVDPKLLATRQQAYAPYMERFKDRETEGNLRWNICGWPSVANAQEAEMGYLEFVEFVYKACGLDQPDPVAYWQEFRDRQSRLVDWLAGKKHLEARAPGLEMTLDFEGRPWVSCHGDRNFPDGEIYVCPIEDSVNGHVEFNFPSVYGGREVNGVQLTFKDGVVDNACAAKGEDYLFAQLDTDDGAKRLGEFAIGTNMGIQRFTREILFDEKIGGTIHMALGRGFPLAGGKNESVVHWDMVHNMMQGGEVYIDGELFYKEGQFMVD